MDASGNAYVMGTTRSADFPTTGGAFQPNLAGDVDAWIAKLCGALSVDALTLTFSEQDVGTTSAPQTVTLTNTSDSTLTITSVAISGDFDQTNTCLTPLAVGESCAIDVTFTPTATGLRTGELTITDTICGTSSVALTVADFSLSASPTTRTITTGESTTYALTLSSVGGFTGVSLSCSGAPARATCSIAPTMVNLDGTNDANAEVTVTTTARSMVVPPPGRPSGLPWLPWVLASVMLTVLATVVRRRAWLSLAVPVLLVVLWTSCGNGGSPVVGDGTPVVGGGTPGTPTGTFTLTVTATSGGVSRTIPLTLTVN